jgi:ribosomal protein S1
MSEDESAGHKKVFKKGDKILVVIKSIDSENRKISLSTRDVQRAEERKEIESYIDKDENYAPTSNLFGGLKKVMR